MNNLIINGQIIESVNPMDLKDFTSLKEIALILESNNIDRLELGRDKGKEESFKKALEELVLISKELELAWSTIFNSQFTLEELEELEKEDSEKYLKTKYIYDNEYDKKLSFVKLDKLLDIVDFPDFSELISLINSLKSIKENSVFEIIEFKEAYRASKSKYPRSYFEKIADSTQVILEGRNRIEFYLKMNLYISLANSLKEYFNHPKFDMLNERIFEQRVIRNASEQYKPYLIDKIGLINKAERL